LRNIEISTSKNQFWAIKSMFYWVAKGKLKRRNVNE